MFMGNCTEELHSAMCSQPVPVQPGLIAKA